MRCKDTKNMQITRHILLFLQFDDTKVGPLPLFSRKMRNFVAKTLLMQILF